MRIYSSKQRQLEEYHLYEQFLSKFPKCLFAIVRNDLDVNMFDISTLFPDIKVEDWEMFISILNQPNNNSDTFIDFNLSSDLPESVLVMLDKTMIKSYLFLTERPGIIRDRLESFERKKTDYMDANSINLTKLAKFDKLLGERYFVIGVDHKRPILIFSSRREILFQKDWTFYGSGKSDTDPLVETKSLTKFIHDINTEKSAFYQGYNSCNAIDGKDWVIYLAYLEGLYSEYLKKDSKTSIVQNGFSAPDFYSPRVLDVDKTTEYCQHIQKELAKPFNAQLVMKLAEDCLDFLYNKKPGKPTKEIALYIQKECNSYNRKEHETLIEKLLRIYVGKSIENELPTIKFLGGTYQIMECYI